MTAEEWRPLPGNWSAYEVSSLGRLRRDGRLLLGGQTSRGYKCAILSNGKGRKNGAIHVLVAEAFLGPRPDGHHVAHLDGNRENNTLSNLAYVTARENASHKALHGTQYRGEAHHDAKLSPEIVAGLRAVVRRGCKANGYLAHARRLGVDVNTVRRAVLGLTWQCANERGMGKL